MKKSNEEKQLKIVFRLLSFKERKQLIKEKNKETG